MATRTRSRASCTAASGNPTMENPGNPGLTSTSTSTGSASIPNRLRLLARHTLIRDTPPKPSPHPCLNQEPMQYIRPLSPILYWRILFYTWKSVFEKQPGGQRDHTEFDRPAA